MTTIGRRELRLPHCLHSTLLHPKILKDLTQDAMNLSLGKELGKTLICQPRIQKGFHILVSRLKILRDL